MRLQRDARWTRVWSRTLGERPTSAQGVQRPRSTSTYQTPRNAFTPRPSDLRVSPWPCRRRRCPSGRVHVGDGPPHPHLPPSSGEGVHVSPLRHLPSLAVEPRAHGAFPVFGGHIPWRATELPTLRDYTCSTRAHCVGSAPVSHTPPPGRSCAVEPPDRSRPQRPRSRQPSADRPPATSLCVL